LPDAQRHEKRNRRGLLVEPHPHHCPSRMSLMIGSSFKERAFQSSQSPFTLRQTRLIVSFPTALPTKPQAPGAPGAC
jgi:hypothetical protein